MKPTTTKLRTLRQIVANQLEGSVFGMIGSSEEEFSLFKARIWNGNLEHWSISDGTWFELELPAVNKDHPNWLMVLPNPDPYIFV